MRDISPEFRLAAACCRWPPSEERLAEIRRAAAAPIDWSRFLFIVKRHRIVGLASEGLVSAGIAAPLEVLRSLVLRAAAIEKQNAILAAEAVRLQGLFDAAGIPAAFLKGVSLAQLAYGSLRFKHGRDIDLLVCPSHADAAWNLLECAGYALCEPDKPLDEWQRRVFIRYSKEITFRQANGNVTVELHWKPTEKPWLLRGVDAASPMQCVSVSPKGAIRTLNGDDLFCYLAVHGAVHNWFRLKWLADFNALLAGMDDAEVERLARVAQTKGAGVCAGQALLLCRRIFDRPLSPALETGLGGSLRLRRLSAMAVDAMLDPCGETETLTRLSGLLRIRLTYFLFGQDLRSFLSQCRIVYGWHMDMIAFPLPRPLHFLYPVLRIPLWLLRRLRGR